MIFLKGVVVTVTAIITGASSGLGREFALQLKKTYPHIESFWLIARRKERLEELAEELGKEACFVLPLDLTKEEDLRQFKDVLSDTQPEIAYLINNAGFGKLGNFAHTPASVSQSQVRLNCEGMTAVAALCLPYMNKGSQIINTASIASFAPNPRLTVYSATKAYVYHFSRGLRYELAHQGIHVLAVCPGPMDTEFLSVASIEKGASHTFDTLPRVLPAHLVRHALIASKKGKAVYTDRFFYRFYHLLCKILPTSWILHLSKA